jgi:hypothetical protein
MRSARRVSIIALMALFAAVALAAGERATGRAIAPDDGAAAPVAVREVSVDRQVPLPAPWADPDQSSSARDQGERNKTLAWLLLLLKEHRSVR